MHSHSQPHSQASAAPVPAPKRPQHQRRRTLSNTVSISPTGSAPKITLAAQTSTSTSTSAARSAASGAFTLTGCARAALRGLATGTYDDESDSYTDSYTDSDDQYTPRHARTRSNYSDKDVPSISRTASPFEERQSVPPGWGARPRGTGKSQKRERSQHREQSQRPRIHAVLESVERGSRVGTGRVVCAACAKPGVNFPRCTRCSKMWCSRACRTAAVHRCPPRRSQTG
ncbi:hypothetical protein DFH06DRAFT_596695 [Mycena polygramma]|nr:hypothetical protein DFH06DRAFT_596695 [Mycena polygramma]